MRCPVRAIYFTKDWFQDSQHQAVLEQLDAVRETVTVEVMAEMSATETPPGVLALANLRSIALPVDPSLILILDALATPGNMGSILRTAAAAAVDAVLLAPGCVDAYNPKVVRGAMGAHFRLPIQQLDWSAIADYCASTSIWLSEIEGHLVYTDVEWRQPSALIIGNEAHGVSREARRLTRASVTIPMSNATESLNATSAASVILFEAFRQRGFPGFNV